MLRFVAFYSFNRLAVGHQYIESCPTYRGPGGFGAKELTKSGTERGPIMSTWRTFLFP